MSANTTNVEEFQTDYPTPADSGFTHTVWGIGTTSKNANISAPMTARREPFAHNMGTDGSHPWAKYGVPGGRGPPGEPKFSKFRKKKFYLWIFGLQTTTTRYLGPILTTIAPGTFLLGVK